MSASAQKDTPRVAFVSTRIAGTDGVSLEIAKWAHVSRSALPQAAGRLQPLHDLSHRHRAVRFPVGRL